jgi:hypothetical protein
MFAVIGELNWFAIIIATFAYYILGAVWFTPLFGKSYDKATGVQRAKNHKWPMIYYIGPFISSFVVAIATALLIYVLHIQQLSDALMLGVIVGIGYASSISFNNSIAPNMPKPLLFGAVTGAYHLVGIILVAAIIFSLR